MIWKGVMPAITTCFDEALQIDHGFLVEHCRWLLDNWMQWRRGTAIDRFGQLGR